MKIELEISPEAAEFISNCIKMGAVPETYTAINNMAEYFRLLTLGSRKNTNPLEIQRVVEKIDSVYGVDSSHITAKWEAIEIAEKEKYS